MLKTWTEDKPKPERDHIRKMLRRASRVCAGLTRCLIRNDMARYIIWRKLHKEFYEY